MNLATESTPNVATLLQLVTSALFSFLLLDGSSCYQSDDFRQPQLLYALTKTRRSFKSHVRSVQQFTSKV